MNVSFYMKGDYEETAAVWAQKNKANSKPNKPNRQRLAGNPKHNRWGKTPRFVVH